MTAGRPNLISTITLRPTSASRDHLGTCRCKLTHQYSTSCHCNIHKTEADLEHSRRCDFFKETRDASAHIQRLETTRFTDWDTPTQIQAALDFSILQLCINRLTGSGFISFR